MEMKKKNLCRYRLGPLSLGACEGHVLADQNFVLVLFHTRKLDPPSRYGSSAGLGVAAWRRFGLMRYSNLSGPFMNHGYQKKKKKKRRRRRRREIEEEEKELKKK
ncbi:forkhead-associated (FHA) domain-containing protein [Striga asiatica]|uniref:Forkhead-associated (FHA) domain-containing protein n=1 Tax=Striga asiatica TaxID=4170 RepID=A0A5A7QGA5_STRAF|nr:forkhead-associated (FHA) domain-containing protein [Striga asiatica]